MEIVYRHVHVPDADARLRRIYKMIFDVAARVDAEEAIVRANQDCGLSADHGEERHRESE
jgi:hypothetical protein